MAFPVPLGREGDVVTGIVLTLTCPACGLVITDRWEAEIVFKDEGGGETVTYCACRRCSHLWVTGRR